MIKKIILRQLLGDIKIHRSKYP